MTWKTSFPKTVFLKYRALSITMVPTERDRTVRQQQRQTSEQTDETDLPN